MFNAKPEKKTSFITELTSAWVMGNDLFKSRRSWTVSLTFFLLTTHTKWWTSKANTVSRLAESEKSLIIHTIRMGFENNEKAYRLSRDRENSRERERRENEKEGLVKKNSEKQTQKFQGLKIVKWIFRTHENSGIGWASEKLKAHAKIWRSFNFVWVSHKFILFKWKIHRRQNGCNSLFPKTNATLLSNLGIFIWRASRSMTCRAIIGFLQK